MASVQSSSGPDLTARLNQILAASQTSAAPGAVDPSTTAAGTSDRFLKLLVAQMNNQDPLNPMDNSQVTSQMAQINTVAGIEKLNTLVSQMVQGSGINSPLAALGMIGRQVLVDGTSITRSGANDPDVRAGFNLAAAADSVKVSVVDAGGREVFSKSLGATAAGLSMFQWDGKDTSGQPVPAGSYQLKVSATSGSASVAATPQVPAQVLGITQDSSGVQVQLAGRNAISANAIKTIL